MTQIGLDGDETAALTVAAPELDRWPRPARFLFILAAATLCWVVPLTALYLVLR